MRVFSSLVGAAGACAVLALTAVVPAGEGLAHRLIGAECTNDDNPINMGCGGPPCTGLNYNGVNPGGVSWDVTATNVCGGPPNCEAWVHALTPPPESKKIICRIIGG